MYGSIPRPTGFVKTILQTCAKARKRVKPAFVQASNGGVSDFDKNPAIVQLFGAEHLLHQGCGDKRCSIAGIFPANSCAKRKPVHLQELPS
jgi:hypothetical protein